MPACIAALGLVVAMSSALKRSAPPLMLQGADVNKFKESIKEKDVKINELMEDLGNKEMLLSEAQASLAKVGAAVRRPA